MVTIDTTTLTTAAQGSLYTASFSTSGAVGSVTWTIDSGRLPDGLSFGGGVFSGIPTEAGVFLVTFTATDSGGPNATITIPIMVTSTATGATISIVATRTTATAPVGLTFDASGTTHTGVTKTFRELHYFWWYDDPGSYTPYTRDGIGGHFWDTPGSYTVTLAVVGPGGTCSVSTQAVTISDPDVTFAGTDTIVVSTSGTFTGKPTGATEVTTSDWATVVNTHINQGKRVLLRYGETWTSSTAATLDLLTDASETQIGAFGTPTGVDARGIASNNPVVDVTTSGADVLRARGDKLSVTNLTVARSSGTHNPKLLDCPFQALQDVTIARCKQPAGIDAEVGLGFSTFVPPSWDSHQHRRCVFAENDIVSNDNVAIYGGGDMIAILGNRFASDATHAARLQFLYKACISNNVFDESRDTSHAIKLHGEVSARSVSQYASDYTEIVGISDNTFTSVSDNVVEIGPQNGSTDEWGRNIVFHSNTVIPVKDTGAGNPIIGILCDFPEVTIRNNVIAHAGTVTALFRGVHVRKRSEGAQPTFLDVQDVVVENNTIGRVSGSCSTLNGVFVHSSVTGTTEVHNNLLHDAGVTGSTTMTDGTGTINATNNLVSATPGFVDAASQDFSLASPGAPPVGGGGGGLSVFDDLIGTVRDASPDIGAFEYFVSSTATVVTPTTPTAPRLISTTTALPTTTVGEAFLVQLTASGGNEPYTWSLVAGSGTLPSGLALSTTGSLSGTTVFPGSSSFTVRVTDSSGSTADQDLHLAVASNAPPTVQTRAAFSDAPARTSGAPTGGKASRTRALIDAINKRDRTRRRKTDHGYPKSKRRRR